MENEIRHILVKHFSGKASPEEERTVESWLAIPGNKDEYLEYKEVWELTGQIQYFDAEKGWNKFRSGIEKVDPEIIPIHKSRIFPWLKVAATLAVIITTGALFYILAMRSFGEKWQYTTASNETGKEILLADGTKIWLNENSKLRKDKNFGKEERKIFLIGEAYFEVVKNPDKIFIIETEKSITSILGTSFNLRSYEDENEEVITMLTGRVEFASRKTNERINVEAGKEAVIKKEGEIELHDHEDKNFLAWKTRKLNFSNDLLGSVAKDLERYFSIQFEIANLELESCRFTGTFVNPALNDVLETLSVTMELEIEKKENSVIIRGKGC